ncbi:MAG: N-acetylmuramoyl-L-alanine amidase [Bacteroidetes bacterium]|nr:N-acetylmuramoyl-L-alanine amidase [Bacteroidota bacterium]NCQ11563.1 N-acetylmuramoyl-L-alanine amidase [Bacteroidota bacterium]
MKKYCILLFFFISTYSFSFAQSQSEIKRLSIAKRSDGKGYVIRFHLSASLDSAKIIQSGTDLIQFAAYSPTLVLPNAAQLSLKSPIKEVNVFEIIGGAGFDIKIEEKNYFITSSYPDANKKDWLIALTIASKNDLAILTEGISPIDWTTQIIPNEIDSLNQLDFISDSLVISESELSAENDTTSHPEGIDFDFSTLIYDDSYNKIKDKAKIDRVVIDAGHGGKDSGSLGYSKVKEKDIALSVALKLGKLIMENIPELQVIYTRKDDRFIPLEDRGHFANKVEGDLFISIHTNAAKARNAYGTEVYFLGQHKSDDALEVMKNENSVVRYENSESESQELTVNQLVIYELSNSANMANSQLMAGLVHDQFKNRAGRHSRGVKQAGFIVLYYASMPSVLVELGFISNKKEEYFLKSNYGQEIIASAIYRAVKEYKQKMDVN